MIFFILIMCLLIMNKYCKDKLDVDHFNHNPKYKIKIVLSVTYPLVLWFRQSFVFLFFLFVFFRKRWNARLPQSLCSFHYKIQKRNAGPCIARSWSTKREATLFACKWSGLLVGKKENRCTAHKLFALLKYTCTCIVDM